MFNFNYKQILFFYIIAFISLKYEVKAQMTLLDTLKIKAGYILKTNDTIIKTNNDTTIVVKSGSKYKIKEGQEIKSERFYNNIKDKSKKNWFFRELYNNFIIPEKDTIKKILSEFIKSDEAFIPYEGKIIGTIKFKSLDIFGGSVSDTSLYTKSKVFKSIENTHINTRNSALRKNLLFKSGNKIDPIIFADTERKLRSLAYISDARILIETREFNREVVDIIIVTKDNYSLAIDGALSSLQDWHVRVTDKNFLGLGNELSNTLFYDKSDYPIYGYNGYYVIDNIASSFIKGEINYLSTAQSNHLIFDFKRNFISVKTKYGGGLSFGQINENWTYYYRDSTFAIPFKRNFADLWIGRAFIIDKKNKKKSVVLSSRFYFQNHLKRDIVNADTNQFLHNNKIALASIIYRNRDFYKTSMLLEYGLIEDVPIGLLLQITGGTEFGEFQNRNYFSIKAGKALILKSDKYIAISANYGSYFNKLKNEEALAKFNFRYFSNLQKFRIYKFRQVVELSYTESFNSLYYQNFSFSNEIYGINSFSPRGVQKASLNFETISFLPICFYKFKFAAYNFIDMGFINSNTNLYNKENFYTGFGFGLRISNKNLVFSTLNISFSFYPKINNGAANYLLNFEANDSKLFKEIDITKPDILKF
ncbi:MAG: hypothetical protein JXR51_00195 [Bacteroidales bacterium]|nr:hypothetical protein [Bacteroidales bacterium]MBN2755560.1 hypothetical protein [Bacteroidales bacterium]